MNNVLDGFVKAAALDAGGLMARGVKRQQWGARIAGMAGPKARAGSILTKARGAQDMSRSMDMHAAAKAKPAAPILGPIGVRPSLVKAAGR